MKQESKNIRLNKSLYKISQYPTERVPAKIGQGKADQSHRYVFSDDDIREMRRLKEVDKIKNREIMKRFSMTPTQRNWLVMILNYSIRSKV